MQGLEKDVIILSTVVTRPGPFASDARRLCTALTRVRHHLILIGHAAALQHCAPALAATVAACGASPAGFHASGRLQLPQAQGAAGPGAPHAMAPPKNSATACNLGGSGG